MTDPQFLSQFAAGQMIFREGDAGTEMYIIQEGRVEILMHLRGQERRVAVLEEGDFFGEMAILEDLPRSASARALGDCVLLRIDETTFDQMARHNPEVPVRMLRKLSRRLREANPILLDVDPRAAAGEVHVPAEPQAPAAPAKPARGHPRLVHAGIEFPLASGEETFIGRPDAATGFTPDVDLRQVDTSRSTSRRHARIVRRGDTYLLREEIGTANGTFVNGKRLATGVEVELRSGDEVRFGAVSTVFQTG